VNAIKGISSLVEMLAAFPDEFSFRYNLRKENNGAGFKALLGQCEGRLAWRALTA